MDSAETLVGINRSPRGVAGGSQPVSTEPLVLVADDEKRITKLVSMALTDEGFRVVTAASSLTTAPRRPEAALHRRCRDAPLGLK